MTRFLLLASLATLLGALGGCSSNSIGTGNSTSSSTGGGTTTGGGGTTGSSTGSSQPVISFPGYPGDSTTWGVAHGNIFPDYQLAGGAAPNFSTTPVVDSVTSLASNFSFLELYKLAGFRYVFVDISAVWCPHCNEEAQTLPSQYVPKWLSEGGLVFSVLVQGNDQTTAATQADLTNWITEYQVNYPMSLDTEENTVTGTGLQAWPANIIVRLSDMAVIDSVFGATDAFYAEFDSVLTQCSTSADCWSGATCNNSVCSN